MPLLNVVATLIVVGVLLYAVNAYLPMDARIKSITNAVVVIVVLLWLLQVFGIATGLGHLRVGG